MTMAKICKTMRHFLFPLIHQGLALAPGQADGQRDFNHIIDRLEEADGAVSRRTFPHFDGHFLNGEAVSADADDALRLGKVLGIMPDEQIDPLPVGRRKPDVASVNFLPVQQRMTKFKNRMPSRRMKEVRKLSSPKNREPMVQAALPSRIG